MIRLASTSGCPVSSCFRMAVTVLLLHAGTDDREMYAEYLRAHAFEVLEAGSTDEAAPLVDRVDVLITGLLVPGSFEAVELIEAVRRNPHTANKPVIVVTACVVPQKIESAQRAGADVVLMKPCLPDALLAEVRRALLARHGGQ